MIWPLTDAARLMRRGRARLPGKAAWLNPCRNPGAAGSGSPELSGAVGVVVAREGCGGGVAGQMWWSSPCGGGGVAGVAGPGTAVDGVEVVVVGMAEEEKAVRRARARHRRSRANLRS